MDSLSLYYDKPAYKWEEALPVGNGRLGAMVTSGSNRDTLFLNEDSIWSGGPIDRNNPDAYKYLGEIRRLLHDGKIPEAEKLAVMALSGTPNSERSYQMAGVLTIDMEHSGEVHCYKRELDLHTGCVTTSYKAGESSYKRELIASRPDGVIVYHLTADEGPINLCCRLSRDYNNLDDEWASQDEIGFKVVTGIGIPFAVRVKARSDGMISTIGDHLLIRNAKEADLIIDIRTRFYHEDYLGESERNIKRVCKKSFADIYNDHLLEYKEGFEKLSLCLGDGSDSDLTIGARKKPVDKRLFALKNGESDPDLFALYFQYGRYLLFSSSRGKCLPANLQGIWNSSLTPPWGSKFTININLEMNYWIAESGNLSSCHEPYFELLKRVCDNGKETAKKMYGCRGFVAHHNTDIYADTAPQDHYIPASYWVMGGAFMATHIWEHYLFTGDEEFLKENFDVLKECVDFFEDFLIKNDKGDLVVSPTVSPENTYILKSGVKGCLCEGATMDTEILMELLNGYIGACKALSADETEISRAKKILDGLPKIQIGRFGQIMEWMEDYDEEEPGHRHISHLYGVYPGSSISFEKTPDLMKAARKTLERRLSYGGGHTGWSRAWIIGLWAHFLDGEKVYENLKALLTGSTFDNLMDNHPYHPSPIFQIDGNLGAAAAMLEMLVQGRDDEFVLLPALPSMFSKGSVKGVRLRGGLELSMEWKDMKVTDWELKRTYGEKTLVTVNVNGKALKMTV